MIKPGQLLVAYPNLPQSSLFGNSVILITEHTDKGAAGLILNKQSRLSTTELLKDFPVEIDPPIKVHTGGPVNSDAMVLLHSDEWYSTTTYQVPGGLALSSDLLMLEKFAQGDRPLFWRLCIGMCGWMPGQLESELGDQLWLTCDPEPAIMFEYTGRQQWRKALELCATQAVARYF